MAMDPYEILGISKDASMDEVKRAYRKKARENHPDLNPGDKAAAERMNQINEAYDRIINPDKYKQEDARRAAAQAYANGGYGPTYGRSGYGYGAGYGGYGSSNGSQGSPFGWASGMGFDYDDIFGARSGAAQVKVEFHPEAQASDSGVVLQAITAINSKNYTMAIKLLNTIKSSQRDARWCYLYAIANYGANNIYVALEHIKKAMRMDPTNAVYKNTAEKMQKTGQAYQQTSQRRGFSTTSIDPTVCCCVCIMINMVLGGGCFGVPLCFRF